jgi:hypothetical protein
MPLKMNSLGNRSIPHFFSMIVASANRRPSLAVPCRFFGVFKAPCSLASGSWMILGLVLALANFVQGNPITGDVYITADNIADGYVPLDRATNIAGFDLQLQQTGDYTDIGTAVGFNEIAIDPATGEVTSSWGGGNTETFVFEGYPNGDIYTFVINPLTIDLSVGLTSASLTGSGMAEITNRDGLPTGYDPTAADMSIQVSDFNQPFGFMSATFAATGIPAGDPPGDPIGEDSNAAVLMLIGVGGLDLGGFRRRTAGIQPSWK